MMIFIDESINETASGSRCACISGVALKEEIERDLARRLFELKKAFWNISDPMEREIKGRDLLSRRRLRNTNGAEFSRRLISLIKDCGATVFGIMNEEELTTTELLVDGEKGHITKQHYFLLQRIAQFMKDFNPDGKAILVFDGQERENNKRAAQAVSNFLFKFPEWRSFENIYSTPFFADSGATPGLQLADFVAYCLCAYSCGRKELAEFHNELYRIQYMSTKVDLDQTGRQYLMSGVYKIRKGTGESFDSAAPPVR